MAENFASSSNQGSELDQSITSLHPRKMAISGLPGILETNWIHPAIVHFISLLISHHITQHSHGLFCLMSQPSHSFLLLVIPSSHQYSPATLLILFPNSLSLSHSVWVLISKHWQLWACSSRCSLFSSFPTSALTDYLPHTLWRSKNTIT